MTEHAFDQAIGHRESLVSPADALPDVPRSQIPGHRNPRRQKRKCHRAGTGPQHRRSQQQFEDGKEREEASSQRERLDGRPFENEAKELSRPLSLNILTLQAQRAPEQPAAQRSAARDRRDALRPGDEQPQRKQRHQQKHPAREPSAIDRAVQNTATEQPPRKEEQHVLSGIGRHQQFHGARHPRLAEFMTESGADRQTDPPASAETHGVQFLEHHHRSHTRFRAIREGHPLQRAIDISRDRRFESLPNASADGVGMQPVKPSIRPESDHMTTGRAKNRDEWSARSTGQPQQHRSRMGQQRRQFPKRYGRLIRLKPASFGDSVQPRRELVHRQLGRRRNDVFGHRWQARAAREGMHSLGEPRFGPARTRDRGAMAIKPSVR